MVCPAVLAFPYTHMLIWLCDSVNVSPEHQRQVPFLPLRLHTEHLNITKAHQSHLEINSLKRACYQNIPDP